MKLGINNDLGEKKPKLWAENLKKHGCKSAVFPVKYMESDEVIQSFVDAAKSNELVITEVGAWSNPISPDEEQRKEALIKCKGQLALADRIGACCCVNIAGAAGTKWDGAYKGNFSKETWDLTVKTIREIIDDVQPTNTYYTIEAMPWMYPMDPDQYVRLIEDVNRDRFAVHMDLCNWIISPEKYFLQDEFMDECFEKLGPFVKSCHLKDVSLLDGYTCMLKEVPCGEGGINLERYVALAEKYDPDMPMLLEHLTSNEAYIKSLSYVNARLVK